MSRLRELIASRNRPKDRGAEVKLAKRLGMKLVPSSGSGIHKSDMVNEMVRLEAKSTAKGSFNLKLSDLHKISREAAETNRAPSFAVTFVDERGDPKRGGKWVVLPEWVFQDLVDS